MCGQRILAKLLLSALRLSQYLYEYLTLEGWYWVGFHPWAERWRRHSAAGARRHWRVCRGRRPVVAGARRGQLRAPPLTSQTYASFFADHFHYSSQGPSTSRLLSIALVDATILAFMCMYVAGVPLLLN